LKKAIPIGALLAIVGAIVLFVAVDHRQAGAPVCPCPRGPRACRRSAVDPPVDPAKLSLTLTTDLEKVPGVAFVHGFRPVRTRKRIALGDHTPEAVTKATPGTFSTVRGQGK